MKRKNDFKLLSFVLTAALIFSNFIGFNSKFFIHAEGSGAWDSPLTVGQAIAIQDNSIKSVQGYIVGVPTAEKTVQFSNFSSDTALAIADNVQEKDYTKMLYIQLPTSFRAEFSPKNKPENIGKIIRVTGNLTPYFTPHSGLKSPTRVEFVNIETIPVSSVTLDKSEITLQEGTSDKLTAVVNPDYATNKRISWSSSDTSVAAVENGVVTAIKAGTATITVTTEDGAKTADCKVIVTAKPTEDTTKPEIKNLIPSDGSFISDSLKPTIAAEYNDASGINISSVKLFIDNIDVTSKADVTDIKISYIPEQNLGNGEHQIKLLVSDKSSNANAAEIIWKFSIGEEQLNWYYGQLHSHTNLSDGQGTPDEAFTWARDNGKADFFAITDHSNWFDNDTKANINDGSVSTEWKKLKETADKYNVANKFVAIGGYEMTWSGSTGGWGHINTFNTEGFETRSNSSMDLKTYYNTIAKLPNSLSQLNHPGKTFGDFSDFAFYSPEVDRVVNLIEVGNGEGAVRSSGYFPSYDYYTRALDKGWHLAPSNNQDNHKGAWITANDARTVVLAPSLTRENIYDGIRKMRVYSTEDKNLKVMYKVNNQVMGARLSKPEKLNISIDFEDPDNTDSIAKVSIISNGGKIVASKSFSSNKGSWNIELNPDYGYYYVRIDEADSDIAVTAPVWTGESTPVGITKVEVSQNPQIINNEVVITSGIYNNTSAQVQNAKLEFFKNEIKPENKIGEKVIESVGASGSASTSIAWVPNERGIYKIHVQATVNLEGKEKVFTDNTELQVVNENEVIKVVIDGGHYNQYVSGDYANKIETLKEIAKEKKLMLIQNKDEITSEDLKNATILILTDPQSKDDSKYNLYKSKYTDSEVQAIKDFINKGGHLIITSRADYNDKGVTDKAYESSNQGNTILEAIGSNLRFNDDEVIDNTSNGGQNFRLYFDDYISSKYNLTNHIPQGLTYSAYSGCSVILKSDADASKVDWLVKGHITTEILDSDLQNDAVPVNKGEVNSLAAEILPSGSKVIAAGTTFFSDFETASADNAYSNKIITNNILDWFTAPELKSISEVRKDTDKDGKPDLLGKKFTIEGRVTAASKAAVKNTAFFDVIYVQDETGGITVFGVSTKAIPLGTKVKVTGFVDQYDGDTELQISDENKDLQITDNNIQVLGPKLIKTAESMKEDYEGWLVKVEGKVTRISDNSLYIDDGSGEAKVYVNGYIGDDTDNPDMLGKWDKNIKLGDKVSAVGLASEDADGHRLRVRNTSEIVKLQTPVSGISLDKSSITLTKGENLKLNASIQPEDATNKKILWKSDNTAVAAVDESGVISAVDGGKAVITATAEDGGFTATCEVNVLVPVTGVKLDINNVIIKIGESQVLTAQIMPQNATNKKLIWSVDNSSLVKVDENGKITALSVGEATVKVKTEDGNYSDTCTITVVKNKVSGVKLNRDNVALKLGHKAKLVAIIAPGNATIKDVVWKSDNTKVATVDADGNVLAVSYGKTIITATTLDGGFIATCEINIEK